ncbi:MAG: cytochrome c biogenesis protein ResB, partial [Planctomycetes bacterium]|nr:cytochrome c biogenesis protein ResB [Planctomycetota bacterium]
MQKYVGTVFGWLGSLKLTITLGIILAAALLSGVMLEATKGLEWAEWYVFGSRWFTGLLLLLAANVAAATLIRRPWRWRHPGLVLGPMGLLVLLAGFVQTSIQETDGQLLLRKGETASSVLLTHRSQLTLLSRDDQEAQATQLGFSPGPADWRSDEPLNFGQIDGIGIKVLQFYRHAGLQTEWVADEVGLGGPAIQVAVSDAQAHEPKERWCVPLLFGSPPVPGETHISIHRAFAQSLAEDFLHPPSVKPGTLGLLSVHCENRIYTIPVDDNIGKRVPVGEHGLEVEIVEYYANAFSKKGEFVSRGTEPKNPMLQLQVYAPDQEKPISEIAYANQPFINLASIRNQECPAEFWYHHPDATATAGAEFLQTPDGKLYCRVGSGGTYQPRGEVKPGDRIAVSDNCQITLLKYLPRARKIETLTSIDVSPGEKTEAEAAALIELKMADRTEQFWLRRNDARRGVRTLETPDGPLVVMFGYERSPLDFSVKLIDFQRDATPDPNGGASCVSQVQLSDGPQDSETDSANDPPRRIAADSPLRHGTFTIYQDGFRPLPNQVDLSVLRVTNDPGLLLKYIGAVMICGGMVYLL